MNSPRTAKTGSEPSRADVNRKAEQVSLSAKYLVRMKKYEGQKSDLMRTQTELGMTVASLNQLRDRMRSLSGQDPGLVQVLQLMSESRTAVHATSSVEKDLLAEYTTTVTRTNTLPFEDNSGLLSQLEAENMELSKTVEHNIQLKKAMEAKEFLQQDLLKEQEKSRCQLKKIKEENGSLQLLLEEEHNMKLHWEAKCWELEERQKEEEKKRNVLESEIISRNEALSKYLPSYC